MAGALPDDNARLSDDRPISFAAASQTRSALRPDTPVVRTLA